KVVCASERPSVTCSASRSMTMSWPSAERDRDYGVSGELMTVGDEASAAVAGAARLDRLETRLANDVGEALDELGDAPGRNIQAGGRNDRNLRRLRERGAQDQGEHAPDS